MSLKNILIAQKYAFAIFIGFKIYCNTKTSNRTKIAFKYILWLQIYSLAQPESFGDFECGPTNITTFQVPSFFKPIQQTQQITAICKQLTYQFVVTQALIITTTLFLRLRLQMLYLMRVKNSHLKAYFIQYVGLIRKYWLPYALSQLTSLLLANFGLNASSLRPHITNHHSIVMMIQGDNPLLLVEKNQLTPECRCKLYREFEQ